MDNGSHPRWQFSLSGILLVLLLAGVSFAIVAPTMRSWTTADVMWVCLQLFIILLPTALATGYLFAQERATRAVAGPLIATAYRPGQREDVLLLWLRTILIVGFLIIVVQMQNIDKGALVCAVAVMSLFALGIVPQTIVLALTGIVPGQVEFRENGLIESGRRFIVPHRIAVWRVEGNLLTMLLDANKAANPGFGPWKCQVEMDRAARDYIVKLLNDWSPQPCQLPFPEVTAER